LDHGGFSPSVLPARRARQPETPREGWGDFALTGFCAHEAQFTPSRRLLGQVLRIFTDTVAGWYRKRHVARGLPDGETGAVTAIQRANSDLRLSPHFHTLNLDGVYGPDRDGQGLTFHPAPPGPTQEDIEQLVERVSKRILRFLQRRKVITLVTAPGDGEVTVVPDETLGAKLLAAATAGTALAGVRSARRRCASSRS
jgi:hypothetical protein